MTIRPFDEKAEARRRERNTAMAEKARAMRDLLAEHLEASDADLYLLLRNAVTGLTEAVDATGTSADVPVEEVGRLRAAVVAEPDDATAELDRLTGLALSTLAAFPREEPVGAIPYGPPAVRDKAVRAAFDKLELACHLQDAVRQCRTGATWWRTFLLLPGEAVADAVRTWG